MRKLTEDDIKNELSDIARWPTVSDFIYMKNLYDNRHGWVLFKSNRDKKPIALAPVDRDILNQSPGGVEAESLEELIRAGWVVD